jgi:hypothetical protein
VIYWARFLGRRGVRKAEGDWKLRKEVALIKLQRL